MPNFDFGSLVPESEKSIVEPTKQEKSPQKVQNRRISSKLESFEVTKDEALLDIIQELKELKKELDTLKQEKEKFPEEVYNALWIMSRSFRSQYRNKGDSMLGQLAVVMKHFNIDLTKNPFDKLKLLK